MIAETIVAKCGRVPLANAEPCWCAFECPLTGEMGGIHGRRFMGQEPTFDRVTIHLHTPRNRRTSDVLAEQVIDLVSLLQDFVEIMLPDGVA